MNAEEKTRLRVCDYQRSKAIKRLMSCPSFVVEAITYFAHSDAMAAAIDSGDHAEVGCLFFECVSHRAHGMLNDIERGVSEFETPMQLVREYERREEAFQFEKARGGS